MPVTESLVTVWRVYLKQRWGRGKAEEPVRGVAETRDRASVLAKALERLRQTELHMHHGGRRRAGLSPPRLPSLHSSWVMPLAATCLHDKRREVIAWGKGPRGWAQCCAYEDSAVWNVWGICLGGTSGRWHHCEMTYKMKRNEHTATFKEGENKTKPRKLLQESYSSLRLHL